MYGQFENPFSCCGCIVSLALGFVFFFLIFLLVFSL